MQNQLINPSAEALARSEWLLFFDLDNFATPDDLVRIYDAIDSLNPKQLYTFSRRYLGEMVEPHINTYLISRSGYFDAGGYDEDFAGYYGFEDVVFRNMWRKYVGSDTHIVDIVFDDMPFATKNLSRDTTRNQALAQLKLAEGFRKPKGLIRFAWHIVSEFSRKKV